jgi:LacI family transcriptional regulator, galactose operon repressor
MKLADIARLAKVSTATVSRTVNRVPTVDPVLARRVRRVIEQVGYYPNIQARALVSGRSRIFGLIVSELSNPVVPEIVEAFTQLGTKQNYEILLTSVGQDPRQFETAARRMIERRVEGVAILTFGWDDLLIEAFRKRNVPVFVIDADAQGRLLKTASIDYEHGIREAVQHLAALGHVHIAFVGGPVRLKTAIRRETAFQRCMNEIGLETSPDLLAQGDHTMEAGMKAMSALASLRNRPTAVVCSNDLTAIGVMRQAFELSLDVPQNLSVVGFDDIRLAEFMIPPLTTVQMSQTEIAETAFMALLESLDSERMRPSAPVIKTRLVLRRSTTLAPHRRVTGSDTDEVASREHPNYPLTLT